MNHWLRINGSTFQALLDSKIGLLYSSECSYSFFRVSLVLATPVLEADYENILRRHRPLNSSTPSTSPGSLLFFSNHFYNRIQSSCYSIYFRKDPILTPSRHQYHSQVPYSKNLSIKAEVKRKMTLSMNAAISVVQNIIGYTFRHPLLLWEALQAPGSDVYRVGDRQISNQGHKRMAMLGDKWLDLVILMDWFVENVPTGTCPPQRPNMLTSEC
jgi:hypothetical protein